MLTSFETAPKSFPPGVGPYQAMADVVGPFAREKELLPLTMLRVIGLLQHQAWQLAQFEQRTAAVRASLEAWQQPESAAGLQAAAAAVLGLLDEPDQESLGPVLGAGGS